MPSKMVRIDEDLYERIAAHKREDETFSEAIDRLIDEYTLLDFADATSGEAIERRRELLAAAEATSIEDHRELLERMGIETE